MGDGQFVVPIVADDGGVLAWGRGPEPVENANFHKVTGTPLRHLRVIDGAVAEISQEAKDALAAEDALAEQKRIDDEAVRIEQQRLDDLSAAAAAASAPFEISKFKLCMAFINAGKGAEFRAFIHNDDNMAFLWDAATVLDSDNPMVLAALEQMTGILPEGVTAQDLLRGCRV
jgi:hypothetical protein